MERALGPGEAQGSAGFDQEVFHKGELTERSLKG